MPHLIRPGDVLAGRYRLVDLLSESGSGKFWRAQDRVLERDVALHVIAADDERADALLDAARRSATVLDQHLLRVLDADVKEGRCFVVNEWGSGTSLDIMLASGGPLGPRQAGWLVHEVASAIAVAHAAGVAHGRVNPEAVLVDSTGAVRVIGLCVDAALHGTGPGSITQDVSDLAGLLYAALTGRWAGHSSSSVPAAPNEHGRVLRPRQVRAGVPRVLDQMCDELLNPYTPGRLREARSLDTAEGIVAALEEFVGDPTGLPASLVTRLVARGDETVVNLPAIPDMLPKDAQNEPCEAPDPVPGSAPGSVVDQPTQAGMPVFDDEADEVSWVMAPGEPAPPPPPFTDPPERPLFAPEPLPGQPARSQRPSAIAAAAADPSDFWPWGPSTGTGTGIRVFEEPPEPERTPGRRTLRVAGFLLAALLLMVAGVVAVSLVTDSTWWSSDDQPTTSPSASALPTTGAGDISGLTATDFDPQGRPPVEYPELAKLAVDGSPATGWTTSTYTQNLGPSGLKTGVGLIIDLQQPYSVSQVGLQMTGRPTGVSIYVSATKPSSLVGMTPAATGTVGKRGTITLDKPAEGRFVVVWLTSLPAVSGGYRGQVDEVSVRGE